LHFSYRDPILRNLLVVGAVAALAGGAFLLTRSSASPEPPPGGQRRTIAYGALDEQTADLWMPAGEGPHPVVVLVHGGFWGSQFAADLMDGLAADLAGQGFAAWNIEYRRVGNGGGWPATFEDVAAATDHLDRIAAKYRLDLDRVATVGHSAGGHLALWLASRPELPAPAPGASPKVVPVLAVSQAGINDLVAGAEAQLGGGAVQSLLGGGPDEFPDRYQQGSPTALAPIQAAVLLVHGTGDPLVPFEQSELYRAAAVGGEVEIARFPGGHFEHIDAASEEWAAVVQRLETMKGNR
jgi:acetyl esterase/lipase